ncbi:MAG: SRPBCC family protein [Jatrophihabitans sp.]
MGRAQTSVIVPGPRDEVFALFADRENYRKLVGPIGGTLVKAGESARQGEGAIHKVGLGPFGISEQIVAIDPGRGFTYRAVTPLPVRHYIGVVEFHDDPSGTRVDYTLDVQAAVPLPAPILKILVKGLAGGLARGATKELRRRGWPAGQRTQPRE